MATEVVNNSAQYIAATTSTADTKGTQSVQQKTLGQDDFFKLLTTQLASQDPMKPMEDTAFIAQMANFSQLEMTSQLTKSFQEFTSVQQFSAAQGYLGKIVTFSDGSEGRVTAISAEKDETKLFIDGAASSSTGHSVDTVKKVSFLPSS